MADSSISPQALQLQADIIKQVEYYLSDQNLRTDRFFHEKISASTEGWLGMELLLNCRKLRELSSDRHVISSALQASAEVELSEDKNSVRRKGNKPLPALEERKEREGGRKRGREEEGGRENKRQRTPAIVLAGLTFSNKNALKSRLRELLYHTAAGTLLQDQDKALLFALLEHHERSAEKLEGAKEVTVGVNKEQGKTKCFMVVKEDGSQQDFSYFKCIERLCANLEKGKQEGKKEEKKQEKEEEKKEEKEEEKKEEVTAQ